jgi:hypothetical protein
MGAFFLPRKRNLSHPKQRKIVEYLARYHCVTPEHLLFIIAQRKKWRLAKMYRERSRRRTLERGGARKGRKAITYAGQGPLHHYLAALGMERIDFCRLFDVPHQTFQNWRGWPLHNWPIELLRWYGYAKNMEAKLKELGYDVTTFEVQLPKPHRMGQYPRKKGDLKVDGVPIEEYSPWNSVK